MTARWWRPVTDAQVCMLALATVMGVWSGGRWWLLVLGAGSLLAILRLVDVRLRRDLVVATLVLLALGGVLSVRSWSGAHPRTLGTYQGWATLDSDPASFGPGVKVVVDVEGERFDATVYGAGRRRLLERQAGERVEVVGERKVATGVWARRAQIRHIVGDLDIERVGAWTVGTELSIASNRLRTALRTAAEASMPADQAALFTGLVIGDDTRQPVAMIQQFRSSGLSHLTAVSGQSVIQ